MTTMTMPMSMPKVQVVMFPMVPPQAYPLHHQPTTPVPPYLHHHRCFYKRNLRLLQVREAAEPYHHRHRVLRRGQDQRLHRHLLAPLLYRQRYLYLLLHLLHFISAVLFVRMAVTLILPLLLLQAVVLLLLLLLVVVVVVVLRLCRLPIVTRSPPQPLGAKPIPDHHPLLHTLTNTLLW